MPYVFGIDGGGTRSRARIARLDGTLVCRLEGESTNAYSVGAQQAMENLRALLLSACEKAGVDTGELAAGCLGSAGLDRPAERQAYGAFFAGLLPCPVRLCNDGEILLVGGLRAMTGYALIGGTGSLALGRDPEGRMVRAGGLGYMLGDEGSACWLGWRAVCRALRSIEGRDLPTELLAPLLAHFELEDPSGFVALMHQRFQKPQVADAAKLVASAAGQGDPLALDLCREAGNELFLLAESVARRMPLPQPRLTFSGGVLEHNGLVRQRVLELLKEKLPRLEVCLQGGTAEEGAVMLAAELAKGR